MEPLGTAAGDPMYLTGLNNKPTYARKYDHSKGMDDLRKKITDMGYKCFKGEGYKEIGEQYNFTPLHLYDGRKFNSKASTMPGGGYFLVIKTYDGKASDPGRDDVCYSCAIRTFTAELEKLAGVSIEEILDYRINIIVNKYFENVEVPKDGDLVIYSFSQEKKMQRDGILLSGVTHAGIYRETERNWNSPSGGSVESQWGSRLSTNYLFQHDVFFVPDLYGDEARFYRIRKSL